MLASAITIHHTTDMAARLNKDAKNGPAPGEGGRPPTPIDLDVVRRAAGIGATVDEIAAVLGVPRRTLYDRMEQDPEIQHALDEGRDQGRITLRRLQWQQAHAGNATMLIWLGKQLLGQRDKHEVEQSGAQTLQLAHLMAARSFSAQLHGELIEAAPEPPEGEPEAPVETADGGMTPAAPDTALDAVLAEGGGG
jgi:hypothetical protein